VKAALGIKNIMNKRWLRRVHRNQPPLVRRVLMNEHQNRNIKLLESLRKKYPSIYAIPSKMANLLVKNGRLKEAIRVWSKTVKQFPGEPNPYFSRAQWALTRRDFEEAQKYLRLCLIRDRGYFRETAHFWRAEALFQLGRNNEALTELREVRDDYEELWFLDYRSRSKSDLLKDLQVGGG
jgi:tetratricopeptide (TPR) repeat protein